MINIDNFLGMVYFFKGSKEVLAVLRAGKLGREGGTGRKEVGGTHPPSKHQILFAW